MNIFWKEYIISYFYFHFHNGYGFDDFNKY